MVDGTNVSLTDKIDRQLNNYTYKQAVFALLAVLERVINKASNDEITGFILSYIQDLEIKLRIKK